MENDIIFIIDKLLRINGYKTNPEHRDLHLELGSHPDLPSFKSITDSLEKFGIANLVAEIPKSGFDKIDQPIVARVRIVEKPYTALVIKQQNDTVRLILGDGEGKDFVLRTNEFLEIWEGVILVIEKNEGNHSRSLLKYFLTYGVFGLFMVISVLANPIGITSIFFGLSAIGLLLSFLAYRLSLGGLPLNNAYCFGGQDVDCKSVINSLGSKLILGLTMTDLAVSYFAGSMMTVLLGLSQFVIGLTSIAGLGFVVYSVYQQAFVLRKWCSLCLAIGLVLVVQAGLAISSVPYYGFTLPEILIMTLSYVFTLGLWVSVKKYSLQIRELDMLRMRVKSFRRNYSLFIPFFEKSVLADTSIDAPDLILHGSPSSPIQVLVLTNPLCENCIEVQSMLNRIAEKYARDVCISVRFLVPFESVTDPRTLVACGMVGQFLNGDRSVFLKSLSSWYAGRNIKEWLNEFLPSGYTQTQLDIVTKHANWCRENSIGMTPSIFINKKRFPEFYDPTDLESFMEAIVKSSAKTVNIF